MASPPKKVFLGVDIGGTLIKLGLLSGSALLRQVSFSTGRNASPGQLLPRLTDGIRSFLASSRSAPLAAGVGIPGLVRYPEGIVRSAVNLPGWNEVPLKRRLTRALGLPVFVDNDVNAMTLAEWRIGAGRGARNLICMTLGTGVGGGLVMEGRLYRGLSGTAGEIGHLPLGWEGPACPCGGRACLEQTVGNRQIMAWIRRQLAVGSKSQILKLAGGQLGKISPELVDRACALGDPLARAAWRRAGEAIGLALAGAVNLLAPERIVIGGGIAKAGKWLFGPIRQTVRRRAMRGLGDLPILPARLGTCAGVVGAALLAQEGMERC